MDIPTPTKDIRTIEHVRTTMSAMVIISGIMVIISLYSPGFIDTLALTGSTLAFGGTIAMCNHAIKVLEHHARRSFFVGAYAAILAEHPGTAKHIQGVSSDTMWPDIQVGSRAIRRNLHGN